MLFFSVVSLVMSASWAAWWFGSQKPPTAASAPAPQIDPRTATTPGVQVAAVRKLSLRSIPAGAQVLRAADRQPLGKTPWSSVQPAGAGDTELIVALPGHVEQRLQLSSTADYEGQVVLTPLPSGTATAPASPPIRPPASPPHPAFGVKRKGNAADDKVPSDHMED